MTARLGDKTQPGQRAINPIHLVDCKLPTEKCPDCQELKRQSEAVHRPGQRASELARQIAHNEDYGDQMLSTIARMIDAKFPAYDDLVVALELGHRILIQRNMQENEREVADMMWAALAKVNHGSN